MAIRLRSWFFQVTANLSRFRQRDKPPQATFEDLLDSVVHQLDRGAEANAGVFTYDPTFAASGHGSFGGIKCRALAGFVEVDGSFKWIGGPGPAGPMKVGSLPAGFAPNAEVPLVCFPTNIAGNIPNSGTGMPYDPETYCYAYIKPNGEIWARADGLDVTGTGFYFHAFYFKP